MIRFDRVSIPLALSILLLAVLLPAAAVAQWSADPAENNAVCTAQRNQLLPQICSDGKGGAIIAWQDERPGRSDYDIYAQRIDANGKVKWQINGVGVTTWTGSQFSPRMIADGFGGAIIVWTEARFVDNDIFAQRIDSSGNTMWTAGGIAIIAATRHQSDPRLCSDGFGGAIICWVDNSPGNSDNHIFAQRVLPNGTFAWPSSGILVCGADIYQVGPSIASDGAGGAIISWQDWRDNDQFDIYAQHITSSGSATWALDGVPVCTASGEQSFTKMVPDGIGGAVILWNDYRTGISTPGIFVQRVNSSGATLWAADGLHVSNTAAKQVEPSILEAGVGSVFVAWQDYRSGSSADVYAQYIDGNGNLQWTANGLGVCTASGIQYRPSISKDESGGIILAWEDKRSTPTDAYTQRVSSAGVPQWTANGVLLGGAANNQSLPVVLSDGSGGGIYAWEDYRVDFANANIYAWHIFPDGSYPIAPPALTLNKKSLVFGTVAKGSSKDLQVKLSNVGGMVLQVSSLVSNHPAFTSAFQQGTIAPGESFDASIRYTPQAIGPASGYFLINTNSPKSPDTLFFSGSGSGSPRLQLSATSLDFGNVTINAKVERVFSLTNSGDDTLTVTGMTTSNSVFRVTTASMVLLPAESVDDTVSFTPTAVGPYTGLLIVRSDDPASPDTIRLAGSASGNAEIMIVPDMITFGSVRVGEFVDTVVTIRSRGSDTLVVTNITSDSPAYSAHPTAFVLPPGETIQDTIRFAPVATGIITGTLSLESNSLTNPDHINAIGTATPSSGTDDPLIAPGLFEMQANHPNPFSSETQISYRLFARGYVEIDVYSAHGARVASLVREQQSPGMHSIAWRPSGLPNGVFLCRMRVDGVTRWMRMTLVKDR